MMRVRLLGAAVALAAAALVLVVFGTGAGDDNSKGDYEVRAIFSNAFTVIAGEDVKISGVKVGTISDLEVTKDNKAAVVLSITEPGFKDFRKDATCTIRPQSLIGERYVECTPTQPKAEGDAPSPKLAKIEDGDGKGQYLLPDSQTIKPVDIDLVGNIMRLPYRQRLSIIINELGTGLAANGGALREAIREANPALEQTDKVLAILAEQNDTLAQLAKNGDEVLRPLARDKEKVADFIDVADKTAVASAERRSDIEASLQKFPAFLRELTPTMERLGGLADQMTPVLDDLNSAAPQINQFIKQLGPFSAAGTPALKSLGDTADVGDQALIKAKPIVSDVATFAKEAKPLTNNLESLLTSLKTTGGIERLMDFLYFQAAATNGYDSLGHYLRAIFVVTQCTSYSIVATTGCHSFFDKPATGSTASVARAAKASKKTPTMDDVNREIAAGRSPFLARQDAVAAGMDPALLDGDAQSGEGDGDGAKPSSKSTSPSSSKASGGSATPGKSTPISLPTSLFPGQPASSSSPSAGGSGTTTTATPQTAAPSTSQTATSTETTTTATSTSTTQSSSTAPSSGASTTDNAAASTLLDYLLGG